MGENKTTLGIYAPIDEGKEGPKTERDEAMGFSQTQTQKKRKKDKKLIFFKRKRKRDYPYL
jgi:hypothetical protein